MSEWISVDDKNPNYRADVLVTFITVTGIKQHTVARLTNNTIGFHSDQRCEIWYVTVSAGHKLTTVTHWMPLPEPPK
jgi:hypothetical protein